MLFQSLDFALSAIQRGLSLLHVRCASTVHHVAAGPDVDGRHGCCAAVVLSDASESACMPCSCFSMLQARCSTAYYYCDVSAKQLRDAGSFGHYRRVYRTACRGLTLELSRHS